MVDSLGDKGKEREESGKATPGRLTLRKDEKLRHRSLVERLFREGDSVFEFPLRMVWMKLTQEELSQNFRDTIPPRIGPLQMMVTVPKKKRRRAVDRVLMRRRIREAYRLNRAPVKDSVAAAGGTGLLAMAFVYAHDGNVSYAKVEKKMKALLSRLNESLKP